jgi:hypothetical protein
MPFLDIDYTYMYKIFWGICDAWKGKKIFDWGKVLNFIKQYVDPIKRENFWSDKMLVEGDDWPANHHWVIRTIGDLLQAGTKDDAWAFPEEYFQNAKEVIFIILDKLEPRPGEKIEDPVTHALNSAFGKMITALIYLALRTARVEDKKGIKKKTRWTDNIRDKYNALLERKVNETYTLLGQYMPNLYYLDKEWVKQTVGNTTSAKDKEFWEAFMDGYLFGGRVHDELYELMTQHYLDALPYQFKNERTEERLIQHICIGYLRGFETLENEGSLFNKILENWKFSQIETIISYFWMQRDYASKIEPEKETDEIVEKIIQFWKWVYDHKYKEKDDLSDEDKKILSKLTELTIYLDKIDSENYQWLIKSAPYVHSGFNSPFFIEYLDIFEDKESISYCGDIFLKMLDNFTPDYDPKHIQSIVEKLYLTGNSKDKDNADKICNIYGGSGVEFLRDIYDKHS